MSLAHVPRQPTFASDEVFVHLYAKSEGIDAWALFGPTHQIDDQMVKGMCLRHHQPKTLATRMSFIGQSTVPSQESLPVVRSIRRFLHWKESTSIVKQPDEIVNGHCSLTCLLQNIILPNLGQESTLDPFHQRCCQVTFVPSPRGVMTRWRPVQMIPGDSLGMGW